MIKRNDTSKNNNPEKTFCMKVSFGVKDYHNFSDILVNTVKRDHNDENKLRAVYQRLLITYKQSSVMYVEVISVAKV